MEYKKSVSIIAVLVLVCLPALAGCWQDEVSAPLKDAQAAADKQAGPNAGYQADAAKDDERLNEQGLRLPDLNKPAAIDGTKIVVSPPAVKKGEEIRPPEFPTDDLVEWFIDTMKQSVEKKTLQFFVQRMPAEAKIKLQLGDEVIETTRDKWFPSAMTRLATIKGYYYKLLDKKYEIDQKNVKLELLIEEGYDDNGKIVSLQTHQVMELEWKNGDFIIHSILGQSSGLNTAEQKQPASAQD